MSKFSVLFYVSLLILCTQCDRSSNICDGSVKVHNFAILLLDATSKQELPTSTPEDRFVTPFTGVGITPNWILTPAAGLLALEVLADELNFGEFRVFQVMEISDFDSPRVRVRNIEIYPGFDSPNRIDGVDDLALLQLDIAYPDFKYFPRLPNSTHPGDCREPATVSGIFCEPNFDLEIRHKFLWEQILIRGRFRTCGEFYDQKNVPLEKFQDSLLYHHVVHGELVGELSGAGIFCKGVLMAVMPYDQCLDPNSVCCLVISKIGGDVQNWLSGVFNGSFLIGRKKRQWGPELDNGDEDIYGDFEEDVQPQPGILFRGEPEEVTETPMTVVSSSYSMEVTPKETTQEPSEVFKDMGAKSETKVDDDDEDSDKSHGVVKRFGYVFARGSKLSQIFEIMFLISIHVLIL